MAEYNISDAEWEVIEQAHNQGFDVNLRDNNRHNLTGSRVQCSPADDSISAA